MVLTLSRLLCPAHRVIGSNGTLTGYGGDLPTKSWLLPLEGIKHKMYNQKKSIE